MATGSLTTPLPNPYPPDEFVISVSTTDIERGVPGEPCLCPIALAARRQGLPFVTTGGIFLGCGSVGARVRYRLPPEASEFIDEFDGGGEVSPITFKVKKS